MGRPCAFYRVLEFSSIAQAEDGHFVASRSSPQREKSSKTKRQHALVQKIFTVSKLTCGFLATIALRMPVAIVICEFEHENKSVLTSTIDIVDPDQLHTLLLIELPAARRISICLRRIDIFDRPCRLLYLDPRHVDVALPTYKTMKEKVMNDEILVELGAVSEETKAKDQQGFESLEFPTIKE
jgi:hypothetical protein